MFGPAQRTGERLITFCSAEDGQTSVTSAEVSDPRLLFSENIQLFLVLDLQPAALHHLDPGSLLSTLRSSPGPVLVFAGRS